MIRTVCKILPHNFNELIDASIAALRKEPFELYPDFGTGGIADTSEYNDGKRGGKVKVRAKNRNPKEEPARHHRVTLWQNHDFTDRFNSIRKRQRKN